MATDTLIERAQVGKKQDLADAFTNADRQVTPFTSAVRKGAPPINTMLEYPVEQFAEPTGAGVMDEADPANYEDPSANDAMLYARIQTFEIAASIGGLATTTTNQAGITPRNVVAKKIAKKLVELKRNIEYRFMGDQDCQVEGTGPNLTRGLGSWISSSAQTTYPVDSNYRTPSASIDSSTNSADYKDSTLTAIFESSFGKHGNEDMEFTIWCGSTWKRILGHNLTVYSRNETNMTTVRQFQGSASDDSVTLGKVDFIETPFGCATVRLNQFINISGSRTSTAAKLAAYLVPMDLVEARFSDQPNSQMLAKTGRNTKFLVTATGALAVLNPLPFGKWTPSS